MNYREVLKVVAVIMLFSYVKFSLTEKTSKERSKESNKKVFIPTNEWQRVEEGINLKNFMKIIKFLIL